MTEPNIIEIVVEKLLKYPIIKFENTSENELKIYRVDKNGFDICLQVSSRENTLHFGTFHWHFGNTEEETTEMLNQLIFGLTGIARLKEYSKSCKAYKWTLQLKDQDENWFDNGTMGTMNFNFWTKADIRYLQNHHLPIGVLYNDNGE